MRINVRSKMVGAFVLTSLLVAAVIGLWSAQQARTALTAAVFDQLDSLRAVKAERVRDYLEQRESDLRVYADNSAMRAAFQEFSDVFALGNGSQDPTWRRLNQRYHDHLVAYAEAYGYDDIFIVDETGTVVYSVAQEADLGENVDGPVLAHTGLAQAIADGRRGCSVVDYHWYDVSQRPAAFVACPIVALDDPSRVGTLVFQLSIADINTLMHDRTGMGQTGETYLVGSDHRMRSDSLLAPETHSVLASFRDRSGGLVQTEAAASALGGESGHAVITDYQGREVLSSWAPVRFGDTTWAVIAEIDRGEALAPIRRLLAMIAGAAIVGMVASSAVGTRLAARFAGQARTVLAVSRAIAAGDLTRTITRTSNDEFGDMTDSLSTMQVHLREIVGTITATTEHLSEVGTELATNVTETTAATEEIDANVRSIEGQVHGQGDAVSDASSAVEQISRSIEALDRSIERQATAVNESSASIEEMIANIRSISSNMESVREDVAALRRAEQGGNDALTSLGSNAREIAGYSATLGELNELISDIAARTNLLAMNAAIEAAHAGDAGRGFAVVAAEIRSLAETSAAQSQKVDAQLKLIQRSIEAVVGESDQTEYAFRAVSERIDRVERVVEETTAAVPSNPPGERRCWRRCKRLRRSPHRCNQVPARSNVEAVRSSPPRTTLSRSVPR